jgi:putative nucleotidyltransferase with HDIG domain
MVLAEDLVDARGRFLLAQGAVIQEKQLRVMKIWGITEADVEGVDPGEAASRAMAAIDPELLRRCEDYVTPFFRNSNQEYEVMREMRRLSVLHLAKRCMAGATFPEMEVEAGSADAGDAPTDEKIIAPPGLMRHIQLASFLDVYYRIDEVLKDSKSSASHLADVIGKDTSLSAKLLRLANSAFYGVPSKIDTVTRAITFIGTKEISTLAMGVLAIRFFKGIPIRFIDMKTFWTHSVACGAFASILAQCKTGLSEERFFVAGLLHDIGRLVMFLGLPRNTTYAIGESRRRSVPLFVVENERFHYDHTKVGEALLEKWDFPLTLQLAVRYHHEPMRSPHPLESSIIHLADIMAIAFQFGHSGEIAVPPLEVDAWEALGISTSMIIPALAHAERLVNEMTKEFLYEKAY